MIKTDFNLANELQDVEITTEIYPDGDTFIFKEKRLSDELTLILYDSGEATLVYGDDVTDNTFYWNDEASQMIENIAEVKALDLCEFIFKHRWVSSI